jgi:predicted DNA-binding protein (MmcQ/YjbR family)/CheY-like chemotaxis protein
MTDLKKIEAELRKKALSYPETYEENPWGHRVAKVKGKIFLFADVQGDELGITAKLPKSGTIALTLPFCEPTHYGMGKHGWVTSRFKKPDEVPFELLLEWIDESYRAVAPKKLLKALDSGVTSEAPPKKKAKKATGKVLVVGFDKLRVARAKKELEAQGAKVETAASVSAAVERAGKKPRAIVIDLGRSPDEGLELGAALGKTAPIVYAGVRDAATTKRAKKASPAVVACLREPPGDAKVVERVAKELE